MRSAGSAQEIFGRGRSYRFGGPLFGRLLLTSGSMVAPLRVGSFRELRGAYYLASLAFLTPALHPQLGATAYWCTFVGGKPRGELRT